MKKDWNKIVVVFAAFFAVFLCNTLLAGQGGAEKSSTVSWVEERNPTNYPEQGDSGKPTKEAVIQKIQTLQMPFIANEGQVDEQVAFYAKTFGGTVFVTKDGEIVYALPKSGDVEDGEVHRKAAKCAKERSEKHISHKDTKNTEERIGGGVLPAATGNAGNGMAPVAPSLYGRPSPNSFTGWHCTTSLSRPPGSQAEVGNGQCITSLPTSSDNANCPPDRIFAKSLLASHLPGLQEGTDKQGLSMPPNSNPHAKIQNLYPTSIGEPQIRNQKTETTDYTDKNTKSEIQNPKSKIAKGVALKEQLVGGKINEIRGGAQSVTTVSYFKGNDPSKWKSNLSTYEVVDMGEMYEGIGLKLRAHGNNVEKLFTVKPGANPEQIKISLSGIQPSENPPPLSPSVRGAGGCL